VAVDASPRSTKLVSFACAMAKSLGARVHLLYVSSVQPVPSEYVTYAKQENVAVENYNEAVGQSVLRKLEAVAKDEGVSCETDLEHGNPAARIVEYSSEPGVELVVVGLRGLHGIERVRSLGSVSRRVAESSAVPVVVVPT
jgi:nucleotide-binding universal stress UspA family protein